VNPWFPRGPPPSRLADASRPSSGPAEPGLRATGQLDLGGRDSSSKGLGIDVVDEGALAVDLDHRQPLAVAGLELGVAADVDLAELEAEVVACLGDDRAGPLAEVTALRVVDDDARRYG